ncbi:24401_t:CDS:2 [Gigaspora margarita]|uniref:24401_t:CDS:1 n=1 Tax=Gigaspora margarita TaxID=4874 RepID=A0ABN7W1T1_GIGMA|nr:24401_t:CDS:2 [Gigaspora margarita]
MKILIQGIASSLDYFFLAYGVKVYRLFTRYCYQMKFVEEEKENFFHPNDSIVLKQAKFEINNCTYNINYRKIDKQLVKLQTQAIAYRSLVRLDESLIRAGAIYNMRQEITHKVNKKISISLVDIDQPTIFEPITKEADITDPTIVSNIVTSIRKSRH